MDDPRPIVLRGEDAAAAPGPPTPGMDRRELLDAGDRWVGWVRTEPGTAGGWHHHGDRDSYLFMVAGSMTIEYGPGGRESVSASAGDFLMNPAWLVHREVTTSGTPAEFFVLRIGNGPQTTNVDGPDRL